MERDGVTARYKCRMNDMQNIRYQLNEFQLSDLGHRSTTAQKGCAVQHPTLAAADDLKPEWVTT